MVSAKILIIDPDVDMQAVQILTDAKCLVQIIRTQKEALSRTRNGTFDIILCDLDAPEIDGIELIQQARALDPTIVPIVMTAQKDQIIAIRALEAGARSFLPKPFSLEDLMLRIQKALRERKRMVDTQLLLGDLIHTRSDLQQKVAERERYLQHLIDAAPFAILSTDRDGRVLTFNGKAEKTYGYKQSEVVGKPVSMLFGKHPKNQEPPETKTHHIQKDGGQFPAIVYRRDILEGHQHIARLYVVEDRSERDQIEQQLLHAERLSLLGQMAPRIAHEFKTPLQIIIGNAQLAMSMYDRGELKDLSQWLNRIPEAVHRMLDLIQQMSNLGKPTESKQENIDLQKELVSITNMLTPLGVLKHCEIVQDFNAPLPPIQGDPVQIEQVFRNLIVNAAHAMEETNGSDVLRLDLKPSSDRKNVICKVIDNGSGIPPEKLNQIFQPFFTTKPEGKGTGLGLPIVKTIMDHHGATIEVDSTVGEGTCFTLTFPASA